MRITIGQRGILAQPLPTLCCGDIIPAGVEIEVYQQHSPKRVWIQEHPERMYLQCGHSSRPADGDMDAFLEQLKAIPHGRLKDMGNLPKACPVHRVKASKIWFAIEEGEEWKA